MKHVAAGSIGQSIDWLKLVLSVVFLSLFSSRTAAQSGDITYNEAVRTVMSPENYTQAFTAFEVIGPAIVLVVIVPFLWNLLYAGFIEEWRCDNYWLLFISTALVATTMLITFPYLLLVL